MNIPIELCELFRTFHDAYLGKKNGYDSKFLKSMRLIALHNKKIRLHIKLKWKYLSNLTSLIDCFMIYDLLFHPKMTKSNV